MQFNKHPKIKPQFNPLRIPTHVLTNSQLWITHPLPLSGITCLPTAIAASLAIFWDSSIFPLIALIEFQNVREKEKGLKPPFCNASCDAYFSLHRQFFANPNSGGVWTWIANNISKFHNNPMVNETGIVVLSRQLWVSAGKEKTTMQRVSLSAQTWYGNSQWWECSKLGC